MIYLSHSDTEGGDNMKTTTDFNEINLDIDIEALEEFIKFLKSHSDDEKKALVVGIKFFSAGLDAAS